MNLFMYIKCSASCVNLRAQLAHVNDDVANIRATPRVQNVNQAVARLNHGGVAVLAHAAAAQRAAAVRAPPLRAPRPRAESRAACLVTVSNAKG